MTRWAEVAVLTREGQQVFMAAILAFDTGKAVVRIAAIEVAVDDLLDIGPPESVLPGKMIVINADECFVTMAFAVLLLTAYSPSAVMAQKASREAPVDKQLLKARAAFDANKMGDMSGYDPSTWVSPTGDTIRIGLIVSFSGPAAVNGQFYWTVVTWVAHDINKRGGILVDGRKKLIQVIKGDSMGKIDQTKKIAERLILQEKVHVLWGCDGSHIMKVINEVANKYKVVALNAVNTSDDIQNAENFGRYAFQGSFSCDQVARGLAYYYWQIRKKERKFYILCQDYAFGHIFADAFKKGLKEYFPEAQIVGEDYHKLFLTDYAPYLSKIKASSADVIFTGDWVPDAANLAKQAQHMGLKLPFANIWMTDANLMHELGRNGGKDWVHVGPYHSPAPFSAAPGYTKFYQTWHNEWKKETHPIPVDGIQRHLMGQQPDLSWVVHP